MGGPRKDSHLKRDLIIDLLSKGLTLADATAEAGVHRTTVIRWRREFPEFGAKVDALLKAQGEEPAKGQVPDFATFSARYLFQPVYQHQQHWIDLLEGKKLRNLHPSAIYEPGEPNYILINTPPEHAKSTTLSINYPVWRIIKDPNIKIMLVSKTQDMAKDFLFAIKTRLSHPRYASLHKAFGPPGGFRADAQIWAADQIYLGSQRDSGEKDPTVQAVGLGGQIYGTRSDLIVVDDAVVLSNAHEWEKQMRWLQQEVLTRLGPTGILVVVGTRVDAVDLYRQLRNPDQYPSGKSPWTYLAQPAVLEYADDPKDWVTLWPRSQEPWPGESATPGEDGLYPHWDGPHLAKRRGLLNPRTWALAYQQADVEEDAVFDAAKVQACRTQRNPGPLTGEHRAGGMTGLYVIGSMDPAMVGDTAVLVYAVDRHTKKRYVLDGRLRTGATPTWIREVIKELSERYGIHEWRIERNAFQQFLTQDPELQEWLGSRGIRLSEHYTGKNKWDPMFGVASMSVLFEYQLIDLPALSQSEAIRQLVSQLISWSPETEAKTDMVMALWFAEIRAREICKAVSYDPDGPRAFQRNRWLTRGQRQRQVVVNLNDLAVDITRAGRHA